MALEQRRNRRGVERATSKNPNIAAPQNKELKELPTCPALGLLMHSQRAQWVCGHEVETLAYGNTYYGASGNSVGTFSRRNDREHFFLGRSSTPSEQLHSPCKGRRSQQTLAPELEAFDARVNNMNREFFRVPLRQHADKPSRCNVFTNQPICEHADSQTAENGFAQAGNTLGNQQG